MASVPEMIERRRKQEITGAALMRGLVSYDKWTLRITKPSTITVSTIKDGTRCLLLFSSGDAYDAFAKGNSVREEQSFAMIPGVRLFAGPLEDIDQIWVDPLSPYDIFYERELFGRLRDMAKAVVVEEALAALRWSDCNDGTAQIVLEYENYSLPYVIRDGMISFLMAPDSQGRSLAAVFTAEDTFDAFAEGEEVEQLQIDGAALFRALQRMKIDGFVFNCSGPVPPIAFSQAAARNILAG